MDKVYIFRVLGDVVGAFESAADAGEYCVEIAKMMAHPENESETYFEHVTKGMTADEIAEYEAQLRDGEDDDINFYECPILRR